LLPDLMVDRAPAGDAGYGEHLVGAVYPVRLARIVATTSRAHHHL
jgi:hypothetical protein